MKRAYIVEEGTITNAVVLDSDANAADFGAVELDEYAEIGDTVVDGVSTSAAARKEGHMRMQRDRLLKITDWWAVSDRTMSQEEIDYRQALRDVPAQSGFPDDIDWPDPVGGLTE